MIRGIHHIALHSYNFDRMIAFYRDIIGFEVVTEGYWENDTKIDSVIGVKGSAARNAMLRAGNCYLELFEYKAPAARDASPLRPSDKGYTHLALDVVDIKSEYARLKAAGMIFCRDPGDFGDIQAVYGQDPDGNVVEIQETTNDHPFAFAHLAVKV